MTEESIQNSRQDECKKSSVSSRKFDFMEIFAEAHSLAKERNLEKNLEALSSSVVTPADILNDELGGQVEEPLEEDPNGIKAVTAEMGERDPYFLPMTDRLSLCHGVKPLTALAIDPSGARVATGGFDFDVRLWDFGGMDSSCRSFKAVRPCEEHQIKQLDFSPSGEHILVISGSAQAFIITRDGEPVCYTNKGFQYITDPANAKGHTHALVWGCWHPLDPSKMLTCSFDATLRIWDLNDAETLLTETNIPTHKSVIKPRSAQGRKVIPTSCTYSKDSQLIVAGCQDGSIQIWDSRKLFVNTCQLIRNAHAPNTNITCVAMSWDGRQLASRSMDDTLKLWDVRALSKGPVFFQRDLPVLFEQTEVTFSANDKIVATGVSAPRANAEAGYVAFYRRDTFAPLQKLSPGHGSAIRVAWQHRINQVFCASSDGTANVYYDSDVSHNGALLCASRKGTASSRRRHFGGGSEAYMKPYLLTYNEETVKSTRKGKKLLNMPSTDNELAMAAVQAQLITARMSAIAEANQQAKSRVPAGEETLGNRVGSLHQYMVQQIVLKKNEAEERAEKDIRGAILRHADEAKANPFWTKAYIKTQPNPVFYDTEEDVKKDDTPVWKKQKLA